MKKIMQWVLAATLTCGASVFTSCSSDDDDNPVPEPGTDNELVGQWYADVSGATHAAWTYGKAWQQTELKADGTGATDIYYLIDGKAVARENYSFTYTAADGLLTMDIAERDTKTTASYTMSGGRLQLTEDNRELTLQKMDDAKAKDFEEWSEDDLLNVPQPARYTVFVYGNAQGDMDDIIEFGFWDKMQPLLQDHNNVRVVCFYKYGMDKVDSLGQHNFKGKYADPGDIVWFELNDEIDLKNLRSEGLQAQGFSELAKAWKLCDPESVSTFIQFSSLLCPAEQYVFSIWGHGSGLDPMNDVPGKYEDSAAASATRGVIGDEWNNDEQLDMYELRAGIRSAGLTRLNTIFFHNCLMGNMETLTELRGLSDYIVASAHELSSEGKPLVEYIRGLQEKGNTEDAIAQMFDRVCPNWPDDYHNREEIDGKVTESWKNGDLKLIRTAKLDAIIDVAKRLADRLIALYPTQKDAIDKATREVYRFITRIQEDWDPIKNARSSYIWPFFDLADYAHLLTQETGDAEMAAISADLDKAFSDAFVRSEDVSTNEQHLDHYTLSVCLVNNGIYIAPFHDTYPKNFRCNFDQGYEQTTFHKLTGWGNWLRTNEQYLWGNPSSGLGGPRNK